MAEYKDESFEQTVKDMENIDSEKEISVPLFQDMNVVTPFKDAEQPKNVFSVTPQNEGDDVTTIGCSTFVDANIKCDGMLVVRGQVNGNIEAENIKIVSSAKITGDINCKGDVVVDQGAAIKGNISSKSASFAGNVEGNIEIGGELKLSASSIITGDIVTGNISVVSGSVINGKVSIKH